MASGGLCVALGDILRCSGPCRPSQLPLHQWLHHLLVPQAAVPLFLTLAGAAYKVSAFMASIAISLLSCLSWFFFFATDSSKESLFKGKLQEDDGSRGNF